MPEPEIKIEVVRTGQYADHIKVTGMTIALCPHCGPKHGPQTTISPMLVQLHTVWCTVQVTCPVCGMAGPGLSCYESPVRVEVAKDVIESWNALPRSP